MKASIIIPAHNEEKSIVHTLDAVFNQTHPDFEVIVVDNASADRTTQVVRDFARSRMFPVTIVREERKGTMWACESGRLQAIGDVIVRIDADCLPEPDWLRKGLKPFYDERVSGVSGPYDYYDVPPSFRKLTLFVQKYIYLFFNWLLRITHKGGVMIGGNSFMRARAVQSIGGFNTDLIFYGDDTDTAKRMSTQGKIHYDPKLIMKTSGRRFNTEGTIKLSLRYLYHFFSISILPLKKKRS
ncbi:MAG: glycosyltransferase family 2 protein [Patescibacteria group bacterium]